LYVLLFIFFSFPSNFVKMTSINQPSGRRNFLKTAAVVASGITGLSLLSSSVDARPLARGPLPGDLLSGGLRPFPGGDPFCPFAEDKDLGIIGPREGYSPHIGTLVSMMAFMRSQVLNSTKGMTTEQLDFLLDDKANTIGAMLYHLAATNAFYHEHTFKGVEWGKFDPAVQKKFGVAMELGDEGRKSIKGNNLDFYLNLLNETRESTLAEFRQRDDAWLMTLDKNWGWNNYCKWFHVCEHEGNHNGQIKLLKSRLPGAKASKE
jgi:hypothetical protein